MAQPKAKRWVARSYLDNVQLWFHPPCLNLSDDLRLRTVLLAERKEMYASIPHTLKMEVGSLSCAIETAVSTEALPTDGEMSRVDLDQQSVLEALLLYRDRLIKRQWDDWTERELANIDAQAEFADQSIPPLWRLFVSLHHKFPLELKAEEKNDFKSFWEKLVRCQTKATHLQISLGRFDLASEAAGDSGKVVYRLVDYVSSMEALITTNEPEVSFKLPMRMAILIGRSSNQNQDVFDFMRQVYKLRSKLVHGEAPGRLLPFKVGRIEIDFEEVLGRLHSYAHDCLRFIVELIDAGFEKKTRLIDLIDYSALRSELHQSMMSFLDGGQDAERLKHELEYAERAPFCRTLHDERHGALH